jgi:hypothetical protein
MVLSGSWRQAGALLGAARRIPGAAAAQRGYIDYFLSLRLFRTLVSGRSVILCCKHCRNWGP